MSRPEEKNMAATGKFKPRMDDEIKKSRNIFRNVSIQMDDWRGCEVSLEMYLEEAPRSQRELEQTIVNAYLESLNIPVKIDEILKTHYSAHLI